MPDEPVVATPGDTPAASPTGTTPDDASLAAATAPASATPTGDTPVAAPAPSDEPPEWVRRRISEESTRRQRAEAQAAQYQEQLALAQQRMRVLAGLDPSSQEDPRIAQIRQELETLYPGLKDLAGLQQQLEEFQQFYWQQNAQSYMNRAFETLAKEALPEGQSLTPTLKRVLHGGFVAYLEEDADRQQRYLSNDTSLVNEYFTALQTGLFDPYKQRSTSAAASRAVAASRLPRSGPGATLVGRPKQSFKSMDELEAALDEHLKG